MKNKISIIAFIIISLASCKKYKQTDLADWTELTHGIHTPIYSKLFGSDKIHTIKIETSADNWKTLIENVERNHIDINSSPNTDNKTELIISSLPSLNYIPASVYYDNKEWYKVGFRFKGLSSQKESWQNNILKMPIKLDFNEFGNVYETIEQQRFYGFEKMTFANNFRDPSQVREKIAYELLEAFGVKVPQTNFTEIYVDNGSDGEKYFGLYTMVETVEDGMIHNAFGSSTGNCYKPSGKTATLVNGDVNRFELNQKTNKGSQIDDVLKFVDILHKDSRLTSAVEWRTELESVFEVNNFLKFLAVNTVIQNWDTYGIASHNYYLYTQPSNGKIIFIPWDMSESFDLNGNIQPHQLDHSNVSNNWPLIKFLLADDVYYQAYKNHIEDFNENYFIPSQINNRIDELYSLIQASVEKEETGYTHHTNLAEISNYLNDLKTQINNRQIDVQSFY